MKEKFYFRGLNGLRFIAAVLVVIWHSNRIINPSGAENPIWHFLSQNGSNSVNFFFVLSGFLISYLLISEFEESGTIIVKRFYFKRILRIWPIYYFLIIFVQIILPFVFHLFGKKYLEISNFSIFFYLVILPNIPYVFELGIGKIGHLWSIGVEEQFYLVWPLITKKVKKNLIKVCCFIVGLKWLFYFFTISKGGSYDSNGIRLVIDLINNFAIENMAIGGIGAYFVFYHKDILMRSSIFSLQMQIILFGLLFFYMSTNETIISISIVRSFYHILFSKSVLGLVFVPMLFLYVIINTSLNEKSIIRTESKVLNYMGNISYGIYIYHMIAIYMVEALMVKLKFQAGSIFFGAIFLILVFAINIAIASVSFKYFESMFLRMRPKENS